MHQKYLQILFEVVKEYIFYKEQWKLHEKENKFSVSCNFSLLFDEKWRIQGWIRWEIEDQQDGISCEL